MLLNCVVLGRRLWESLITKKRSHKPSFNSKVKLSWISCWKNDAKVKLWPHTWCRTNGLKRTWMLKIKGRGKDTERMMFWWSLDSMTEFEQAQARQQGSLGSSPWGLKSWANWHWKWLERLHRTLPSWREQRFYPHLEGIHSRCEDCPFLPAVLLLGIHRTSFSSIGISALASDQWFS